MAADVLVPDPRFGSEMGGAGMAGAMMGMAPQRMPPGEYFPETESWQRPHSSNYSSRSSPPRPTPCGR